ncbi:MAG: YHYH domain-containing protein [Hydrogenophaga sp.]|nr:YHYH domain-containing protein [Hydrogenophaga sp.]MBX3608694.1 YHYH domain-containing protein [Hydrogenophaga sp.]
MRKAVAFFVVALAATSFAHAHSGGTDKNGCHSGSQPYHCH